MRRGAQPPRESRSSSTRVEAGVSASTSPGGSRMPSRPSVTMSGIPPAFVATTVRPRANASSTTRPSPSGHDGSTRAPPGRSRARPPRRELAGDARPGRQVCDELIDHLVPRAPADHRRASPSGRSRTTRRQAAARPSTFLYCSSAPTKTTRGLVRQRRERRVVERREVAVGRKARGGGDAAHLLDERRRERRERARRVGTLERRPG